MSFCVDALIYPLFPISSEHKTSDLVVKLLKIEAGGDNSQKKSTSRTRAKKEPKVEEEEEEEEEEEAAPSTSKPKPKTKSGRWDAGELKPMYCWVNSENKTILNGFCS